MLRLHIISINAIHLVLIQDVWPSGPTSHIRFIPWVSYLPYQSPDIDNYTKQHHPPQTHVTVYYFLLLLFSSLFRFCQLTIDSSHRYHGLRIQGYDDCCVCKFGWSFPIMNRCMKYTLQEHLMLGLFAARAINALTSSIINRYLFTNESRISYPDCIFFSSSAKGRSP